MANLVRVFDIHLYVGLTEGAGKCYEIVKFFKENNIPYTLLNYSDQVEHHQHTFNALSSWRFGLDNEQTVFTDFPIVVWKEGFDDFTSCPQYSLSLEDLVTRSVVTRKDLIK
jgi:hypothetical protein